jgi:hypothetical protein
LTTAEELEKAIISFILSERGIGGSDSSTKTAIKNITSGAWEVVKSKNAKVGRK